MLLKRHTEKVYSRKTLQRLTTTMMSMLTEKTPGTSQTCHKHQRNTKCKPSPSLPALTGEILELSLMSRIKDNADLAGLSELLLPWKLPTGKNTDQPSK